MALPVAERHSFGKSLRVSVPNSHLPLFYFSLQLAVNVKIPRLFGGLEGRAAYLDTNYGFSPQRIQEMSQACFNHCANIAILHELNPEETLTRFTEAMALDDMIYAHVSDCNQLLEALAILQNRLYDGEKVCIPLLRIAESCSTFPT